MVEGRCELAGSVVRGLSPARRVRLAAELVVAEVSAALKAGSRRRAPVEEEVEERRDRVGEVKAAVVVGVGGVTTADLTAPEEERVESGDGIAQVHAGVAVRVAAAEASGFRADEDARRRKDQDGKDEDERARR
jgi:hypothetical protein